MKLTEKILRINNLQEYMGSSSLLNSDIFKEVAQTAQEVTHSDRASFFIFNSQMKQLETFIAQGLPTKIEVALGEGIVGSCGQSKQAIIENDVDTTKKFNAAVDLGSGYVTTNTLAVPILDDQSELLGVIQVINKASLNYDEKDEQLLEKIASFTAEYIKNNPQ